MKSNSHFTLFSLLLLLAFTSCVKNEPQQPAENLGPGIWVLNQGAKNQSTISLLGLTNNQEINCLFQNINGRSLGDTGNDFQRYGSNVYAVMNGSNSVEVIAANTGVSRYRIELKDGNGVGRSPRSIAFSDQYAYVCNFDGTVAKIDTASFSVVGYCTVGRNPDGLVVVGEKLFVSNSGGLEFETGNYDNTVSVIDLPSFTETKKIRVGSNPGQIAADVSGKIYLIARGNYMTEFKKFQIIDSTTDTVIDTFGDIDPERFVIAGEWIYMYGVTYDAEWKPSNSYYRFNTTTKTIDRTSFITDKTTIQTPYAMAIDKTNGNIYMADALDYTQTGYLYCFDAEGTLQWRKSTGIMPGSILLMDK